MPLSHCACASAPLLLLLTRLTSPHLTSPGAGPQGALLINVALPAESWRAMFQMAAVPAALLGLGAWPRDPSVRDPSDPTAHNSRMPRDPVKRKASNQRYKQSDKGKANKQAYDQSGQGKAARKARSSRRRLASASASAAIAFVTELKGQTHAQRVKDYFSEEELAAAADKVPYCPSFSGPEPRTSPSTPSPTAASSA